MRSPSAGSRSARLTPRLPVDASAPFVRQAASRRRTLHDDRSAAPEGTLSSALPARCVTRDTPRRGMVSNKSAALAASAYRERLAGVKSATSQLSLRARAVTRFPSRPDPPCGFTTYESFVARCALRQRRFRAPPSDSSSSPTGHSTSLTRPEGRSRGVSRTTPRDAFASLGVSFVRRFE